MKNNSLKVILPIVVIFLSTAAQKTNAQQWTGTTDINNTNTGNVGVATSSPGQKLEVNGGFRISGQATMSTGFPSGVFSFENPVMREFVGDGSGWSRAFSKRTGNTTTDLMTLLDTGNVGIGTTSPQQRLSVNYSTSNALPGISVSETSPNASAGLTVNNTNTSTSGTPSNSAILFNIGDANKGRIKVDNNGLMTLNGSGFGSDLIINSNGNVGVGMVPTGQYKLEVNGTINAKYQDVAEWVPSSEQLSAGTVVVLDSTKSNQVTSSLVSYDTRVAGVVSGQPGIALGEKSDAKVLVATTGRVKIKVDASKGAIHIGDLLVTSDIPGVAMKSEPVNLGGVQIHRPGTLIGKALEPLEKGKGEILALLSLQ